MILSETMENGIRIVAEKIENVRSCAIGVWVGTGSAYELEGEEGASHFIEHMLFKGTKSRTAEDIAVEIDSIGGNINAFTSKECTCYYCKVLDEHLPIAVDVLSDILINSVFDEEEIKKEQGVVCEEILMVEDSPEDLVHDKIASLFYMQDALAKPILGTENSVKAFTRKGLQSYMARQYDPKRIVISVAGNFEGEKLLDMLREKFLHKKAGTALPIQNNAAPGGKRFLGIHKDVEQIHICMAFPGTAMDTEDHYPLLVLNNALGGSMSSRLFQKIREQRGLAYSIYSYPTCYRTTGSFSLYAGTGEAQAKEVIKLMLEEIEQLVKTGIGEQEFIKCKDQMKGSYILGQEGTSSRMNALGKTQLLLNRLYSEKDNLRRIENITIDDVMRVVQKTLRLDNMVTACVGRIQKQEDEIKTLLGCC